ncbi:MAG: DUF362 domain-containing protein [Candidatus Binatia bacterium]
MLKPDEVFCARAPSLGYGALSRVDFPELPEWAERTNALATFRSLLSGAGLDGGHFDRRQWNPLAEIIPANARVVLKPNWVCHDNGSGAGLDCLVTHTTVLEAILHYVVLARPKSIIVGDAPIQGCDFPTLMNESCVPAMLARFAEAGDKIELKDFRRTIRPDGKLVTRARDDCRPLDEFVLYDLGAASSLEAITTSDSEFRVTMYNPDLLKNTHGPKKHQYLIARDVVESDVVINVPKLKTHKKAGVTGALKNLVGINGHKEYLPHHRKGNPLNGGDCYAEASFLKGFVEDLFDAANRAQGKFARGLLAKAVFAGLGCGKLLNIDNNYEGSWYGNDTVWRMVLDLQRILRYGRPDGTIAESPQRVVLSVTDAIIAGEGDGPLSPTPIDLGLMTMGTNTAAVEWINTLLMGLSPEKIPLTREAFAPHRYPLAEFSPEGIAVFVDGLLVPEENVFSRCGQRFRLPKGWQEPFGEVSAQVA